MAEKKTTTKSRTSSAKRTEANQVWTDDEVAAMQEHAKEMKAARRGGDKVDGAADVAAKIAAMTGSDRVMAERFDKIVRATAPDLTPRTWYGMPAYAKDGKLICFFQASAKFKARYCTFGFEEHARLDDGTMWPTSWALTELTPAAEAKIAELVRKAVS